METVIANGNLNLTFQGAKPPFAVKSKRKWEALEMTSLSCLIEGEQLIYE